MTQIPNSSAAGTDQAWSFRPTNIAEFFFADDNGDLPKELDMKEVDLLYNDYIRVMTTTHEKLRT